MKTEASEFLQKVIVDDVKFLIENKKYYPALLILSHSIETLGALLDNKPFRAKMQSKRRFNYALKLLFPKNYRQVNHDYFLYNQLRNQITHLLLPGSYIVLLDTVNINKKHLDKNKDGTLYISVKDFYSDVCTAINKLNEMIASNKIKPAIINLNDNFRFD